MDVAAAEQDFAAGHADHFATGEQAKDWEEGKPFPIPRRETQGIEWVDGTLEVRGNAAARHVALFKGDVTVTAKIVPDGVRDIGFWPL